MIEYFKKQMVQDFKFNDDQINMIFETIDFIGKAQDLAWRKNGGVLTEDIIIGEPLLNYLKQGFIQETKQKNGKHFVYKLDSHGEQMYKNFNEKKTKDLNSFREEFNQLNRRIFALLEPERLAEFEKYSIFEDLLSIAYHSNLGNHLKQVLNSNIKVFITLLKKYDFYFELTPFNTQRTTPKTKMINQEEIIDDLNEIINEFKFLFHKNISDLNQKLYLYDTLINSVENHKERKDIGAFRFELEEITEELNKHQITTSFDMTDPVYFKIINPIAFKKSIFELKQKTIDKITEPIINYLLSNDDIMIDHFDKNYLAVKEIQEGDQILTKLKFMQNIIIKNYANNLIIGYLQSPKKKNIEKLKKVLKDKIEYENWNTEEKEVFSQELRNSSELWKQLKPPIWKKFLFPFVETLISIIFL